MEKSRSQKVRDQFSQYSVPCVLHSLEHPKRFTELGREEKGEGSDISDLGEKRESQRGESNQASIHIPPFKENGLPFWVPGVLCQCPEVVEVAQQMIF